MASKTVSIVVVGNATQAQAALKGLSAATVGAESRFAALSTKMQSWGSSMSRAGSSLTRGLTLPIIALGAVAVKQFADVDQGLREVVSLLGETGPQAEKTFGQMTKALGSLSNELGVAQTDLIPGLYQAISAGIPKDNVFDFLKIATKAAIAGNTDVETSVNGLTTVISAFGLKASDTQAVADGMFKAVADGKIKFNELSDSLFNVAPAAQAAGVSFQEVLAAIDAMAASGTPTSVATTQIRAALAGLQRPSADLDKAFKAVGFSSAQAALEQKGLAFALDVARDAADGNNGKLQTMLGSTEAVQAANIIAGTQADKFASSLRDQADAAGSVDAAFGQMNKGAGRSFERLKVHLQNLSIKLGRQLMPLVEDLMHYAEGALKWFNRLSPATKEWALKIAGLAAVVGPFLSIFGRLLTGMGRFAGWLPKIVPWLTKWAAIKSFPTPTVPTGGGTPVPVGTGGTGILAGIGAGLGVGVSGIAAIPLYGVGGIPNIRKLPVMTDVFTTIGLYNRRVQAGIMTTQDYTTALAEVNKALADSGAGFQANAGVLRYAIDNNLMYTEALRALGQGVSGVDHQMQRFLDSLKDSGRFTGRERTEIGKLVGKLDALGGGLKDYERRQIKASAATGDAGTIMAVLGVALDRARTKTAKLAAEQAKHRDVVQAMTDRFGGAAGKLAEMTSKLETSARQTDTAKGKTDAYSAALDQIPAAVDTIMNIDTSAARDKILELQRMVADLQTQIRTGTSGGASSGGGGAGGRTGAGTGTGDKKAVRVSIDRQRFARDVGRIGVLSGR